VIVVIEHSDDIAVGGFAKGVALVTDLHIVPSLVPVFDARILDFGEHCGPILPGIEDQPLEVLIVLIA
jgi:hypothetical protein